MSPLRAMLEDLKLAIGEKNYGSFALLYVMTLVSAGLETLCAGLFVPFTALLSGRAFKDEYALAEDVFIWLGAAEFSERLFVCSAALALAFLVKNTYTVVFTYYKFTFVRRCHADFAKALLTSYMERDYLFHVTVNSASIVRNVNTDVNSVYTNILPSVLTVMVDGLMLAFLLVVLFYATPLSGVLMMVLFILMCVFFYKVTQRKSVRLGAIQRRHNGEMMKWALQGLGSIKETKVMHKEQYFLKMFSQQMDGFAAVASRFGLMRELPRLFIEVGGVVMMLLITALFVSRSAGQGAALPMLSLFAVSAFRMLPAINRLTNALSSIRFYRAALGGVCRDLRERTQPAEADEAPLAPLREVVELREIRFKYPSGGAEVLRGLSLKIRRGESVAFVGSSGAGKTTAVDVLLGLLEPSAGEVLIDGEPIAGRVHGWQRQLGYISQPIYLLDDTVRRNVAFGVPDEEVDEARVWSALERAQLLEVVRALPGGLDETLGEAGVRLSGGQRQRIGIARVLYRDPPILVFDEATSALDTATEQEITQAIEALRGEKTLVIIAHRLSTVRRCDKIFLLSEGKVAAVGDFETLQRQSETFAQMVMLSES